MKIYLFFYFLFGIIISSNLCFGIGIQTEGGLKPFQFSPFLNESWNFKVTGSNKMNISLSNQPLAEYATIIDPNPMGGPRAFKVNLALPKNLSRPGKWSFIVKACEVPETQGGLNTMACAAWPIILYVPYPGFFLEGGIAKTKLEVNSSGDIIFRLSNKGSKDIDTLEISCLIFDENSGLVINVSKTFNELFASGKNKDFPVTVSTRKLSPGEYSIKSQVYYSSVNLSLAGNMMVGDLNAYLADVKPRTLNANEINKVNVMIGVNWEVEKPVFAEIYLDGEMVAKSLTENIGEFGKKDYTVYVDTKNFDIGKHEFMAAMFYAGKEKKDSMEIEIMEKIDSIELEKPAGSGGFMIIIAVIGGLIVLASFGLLLYYLFLKK